MNPYIHEGASRLPMRMCWFLGAAWGLILVKCGLVAWVMYHWQVPFSPAWIIAPTLMFAALATALWLAPHDE
jgi:hypothetical protein